MIHDLIRRNQFVKGEFKLGGTLSTSRTSHAQGYSIAGTPGRHLPGLTGRSGHEAGQQLDDAFCVLDGGHSSMMTGAEARQGLWLKVHRWL